MARKNKNLKRRWAREGKPCSLSAPAFIAINKLFEVIRGQHRCYPANCRKGLRKCAKLYDDSAI